MGVMAPRQANTELGSCQLQAWVQADLRAAVLQFPVAEMLFLPVLPFPATCREHLALPQTRHARVADASAGVGG